MKRMLFLAVIILAAIQAWAGNVDVLSAQARAEQFLNSRAATGKIMTPRFADVELSRIAVSDNDSQAALYYIFNSVHGFVVVSGDDRAQDILAYGDEPLDMDRIPGNMNYWLTCYKRQLEFLIAHPDLKVAVPMRAGQTVNPLISANWSQNSPYWNECPVFGTDTCYTGCPATSLSMVFHYWKYPRQQTPAAPSYTLSSYGTILPELPPTTFDWANMLNDYTNGYNAIQATAVAHLMRYIGQVERMDYTISGSGAYGNDVLRAIKYFEYDQNAQLLFKTDDLGYANYSDTQWGNLIQTELEAGRPIVYLAYDNTSGSGHAFNVDGYDAATGTYHVNWGWNGRGNGHFALNAFSYGDYTFGTGQQMVIGIQPPEDYMNPRLQAYPGTLAMEAYPGKPVTATISFKGTNLTGDVTLTLSDVDGVFSIDDTIIGQAVAEAGHDITVTYSPQSVGTSVATIVCQSQGADDMTITLSGTAPLEAFPPVMSPANESRITLTSFTAEWVDNTPATNVTGYDLEVYSKPDFILLEDVDFSTLPQMVPSNQASHATDYLPEGWSFTGSEFNLEGGCVMPRRNSVITTDELSLRGYDKVTVEVTARSYGSWGDPSELTISTGLASQVIELPFSYAATSVVLDCAEGDRISFKAGYYPMIQSIRIYAGDATSSAKTKASESGDANYRMITGITGKSYTVRDLTAGGTFFYQVRAHYIDGTQSDWSESQIVTLVEGGHDYQQGDVNHDGVIDISDVTDLIDYLLGNAEIFIDCADLDCDGSVAINDVTVLIDILLGIA